VSVKAVKNPQHKTRATHHDSEVVQSLCLIIQFSSETEFTGVLVKGKHVGGGQKVVGQHWLDVDVVRGHRQ